MNYTLVQKLHQTTSVKEVNEMLSKTVVTKQGDRILSKKGWVLIETVPNGEQLKFVLGYVNY